MLFEPTPMNDPQWADDHSPRRISFGLILGLLLLNLTSAALFIGLVNRPVYDDPYNIFDVHNYAVNGLSVATLLTHRNPPGPTSFLWMAAGVRLLGRDELRDARIFVLVSWVLLAAGVLVGARYTRVPELWYGGLLVLLVFPHTLEATATALTEGPSLLFAVLGVLAWTEFISQPNVSPGHFVLGMLGGLSMGLAVTCRQYNLALLPAAALLAAYQWRGLAAKEKFRWGASVMLSLIVAAMPVLLMVTVWKGISSPGMATGTSYNHMWKATVGLNLVRPIVVAFYAAVYLVPLTFPAVFRLKALRRWITALLAVLGGAIITHFSSLFLQPGPLNSAVRLASRLPHGGEAFFFILGLVVVYNAISVFFLLWERREAVFACTPGFFSLLVLVFFVAEQIGVGGNLPFYDRYVLQLAPFLGLIAFTILPRFTSPRLFALVCLAVFSHFMLWRFAFSA
jgi:hypothetical protein